MLAVLAICVVVAVLVYVLTGGHVIFLPLLLVLPLGLLFGRRRRRRW
jgi:hypothetical protein